MTFTTTITPAVIAIEAAKAAPATDSDDDKRWKLWIKDALMLISLRAAKLNVTEIDQDAIDYVVRLAVAEHVKRPDNATQVTIAVDDASSSRTYQSGKGRVEIVDEWWEMLGLSTPDGAYEVDLLPPGFTLGGV